MVRRMTLLRVLGCFLCAGASIGDPAVERAEQQLGAALAHDAQADAGRDRLLRREAGASRQVNQAVEATSDSMPPAGASLLELGVPHLDDLVAEGTRRARRRKLFEKLIEVATPVLEKLKAGDAGAESLVEELVKEASGNFSEGSQENVRSKDGKEALAGRDGVRKASDEELELRLSRIVKDPAVREQVEELFDGHENPHGQAFAAAHGEASPDRASDEKNGRHDDPHAEAKNRVLSAVQRLLDNAKDPAKAMKEVQHLMDMARKHARGEDPEHDVDVAQFLEEAEQEAEDKHREHQHHEASRHERHREGEQHHERLHEDLEHRSQHMPHRKSQHPRHYQGGEDETREQNDDDREEHRHQPVRHLTSQHQRHHHRGEDEDRQPDHDVLEEPRGRRHHGGGAGQHEDGDDQGSPLPAAKHVQSAGDGDDNEEAVAGRAEHVQSAAAKFAAEDDDSDEDAL